MRSWLKDLRQRKGLTQEGLARELDATLSAVQNWEGGRAVPNARLKQALALELGDEVLEHFHREEREQLAAARAQGVA